MSGWVDSSFSLLSDFVNYKLQYTWESEREREREREKEIKCLESDGELLAKRIETWKNRVCEGKGGGTERDIREVYEIKHALEPLIV